ncbi:MAG: MFS transporter [Anaerolineales bacterium]|nr:MFS transporter [Anaerolineales bacterium]MCB8991738.1 MFS transporter [Ardenticatenaceae bacterium]
MTAQSASASLTDLSEQEYKRRIRAWTMYDWANSAFATTILAAVLPAYYSSVAGANLPSAATATQYWSITQSISVFIVAFLSPILGTVSDIMRGKKKFLSIFVTLGVIGTGLLVLVDTGDWLLASIFFIVGRIGFGAANVFYDALLPHVAKEEDQDRVSTQGYALGYLGGGVLLAINVAMIFTMDGNWGVRWSLFSVAIWWAVFSIPMFRVVPEPQVVSHKVAPGESLWRVSFAQIANTLREIRKYGELFKYLIAFLIYNDAIGVIISIAVIYGAELGFQTTELVLAILLVQFVGIPYSLVFGNLPSTSNKRQTMYVAFVIFNIIALPLVGLGSTVLLPKAITGTPSPDFVETATAVGQGPHFIDNDKFTFDGSWQGGVISGEERGETCAWYAFWCDPVEFNVPYAVTSDPGAQLNLPFNGQALEMTYSTGPDHGIWAVEIDGQPVLDDEDAPLFIDAYNPTVRYDDTTEFQADTEGEHILSLINIGNKAPDGSGIVMSISKIEVLPPLRSSNLLGIMGVLLALEAIGLLFAYLTGPRLFAGIAEKLNTKRSIILALIAYAIIAIWGFFLNSVIEFWFLAWMVAVVQGGSQALSRSLYAAMTPNSMSGEFFGFFSIMSKFASFISPLVFVFSVAIFNSSRPGVLTLFVFFAVGIYLLTKVDVDAGKAFAKQKNAEAIAAAAE